MICSRLCGAGRNFVKEPIIKITLRQASGNAVRETPKSVAYWLYGIAGATIVAVSLGGITRLTESGLSMTSWHLIKDITCPTTEEEWHKEFERYKTFPEYEAVHSDLTLDGFKFIYYMEWGHRNWGRSIGVMFMLPFLGFALSKKLSPQVFKRTLGLGCLLGFQGGLGWYMVKSGLEQPQDANGPVRVSPYRLCAHLGTAFTFFVGSLWTALDISMQNRGQPTALPDHRLTNVLKKKSVALAAFTFFVAMSGAFVAGNDAGMVYGTYPKMGNDWIPSDYWDQQLTKVRNMFENSTAVQFNHRTVAHLLILGVTSCWFMGRKAGLIGRPMMFLNAAMALVYLQASMGIGCLLYEVPVPLGAAHQLGSVFLLGSMVAFSHEMRRGRVLQAVKKMA